MLFLLTEDIATLFIKFIVCRTEVIRFFKQQKDLASTNLGLRLLDFPPPTLMRDSVH